MSLSTLSTKPESPAPSIDQLHAEFLAILPRVETHAQIHFRHLRCADKRADAVAEVIALAWQWYLRLIEQGKDINEFVSTVADYAVRHVRAGRRLCGAEKVRDVLSPRAQRQKDFRVEPLPSSTRRHLEALYSLPHGQESADTYEERLHDNTRTPVPDQAAFRIDFIAWLVQLGDRRRAIAEDMARDETTQDLATRHKVSQGRISQMRREFHSDWRRFHGEV